MATETQVLVKEETSSERRARAFTEMFEKAVEQTQMMAVNPEKLAEFVKGAAAQRDELVDAIGDVEMLIDALKGKERRIAEMRRELEKSIGLLREAIRVQMLDAGFKRINGETHKLWLRDGSESIEITSLEEVPAEFIEWTASADKSAIAKALAAGREVPGARIKKGEPSLTIR